MDLLEKIGAQVPALTVLVILVLLFLKHVSKSEAGFKTMLESFQATSITATTAASAAASKVFEGLQEEANESRVRSREIIEANTKVMAENNAISAQQIKALERLTDVLTRDLLDMRRTKREK